MDMDFLPLELLGCRRMTAAQYSTPHSIIPLPFYAKKDSLRSLARQWGDDSSVSVVPHEHERHFWWHIRNQYPPIIIVGAERLLLTMGVIAQANAAEKRPIIVALIESYDEGLLTDCYKQGADRVVVKSFCTSRIFGALLQRLLTRDDYSPYLINPSIQSFKFGKTQVRLTKKTFDLAQYLFTNNGKLITKSKILDDLWGLNVKQCSTRRIDVHVCHIRRLLALDGSYGWEIRSRRQLGYGIFQSSST